MRNDKNSLFSFSTAVMVLILLTGVSATFAAENINDKIGGTIRAQIYGKQFHFPILKNDISAQIEGDLATIIVRQKFSNPSTTPLNASYLFPLNENAAVYSMEMRIGKERVISRIKRKELARGEFIRAQREGRSAALLTQSRPNMFTQEIANLMPGQPVEIILKYTLAVPRRDGAYELVLPLVVGPRYTPAQKIDMKLAVRKKAKHDKIIWQNENGQESPKGAFGEDQNLDAIRKPNGVWTFDKPPAYPSVSGMTFPDIISKKRVSIIVDIKSQITIKNIASSTHALDLKGDDKQKSIRLAKGRTIDNRDFILRYELAGADVEAGLLTTSDKRGAFYSLLIEPPKAPDTNQITRRELVFLLDTSGSMHGQPIETSKAFMRHALNSLDPGDSFRIVTFSNRASEFKSGPLQANRKNKRAGINFVNALSASGGTEVVAGIRQAFSAPQRSNSLRIVAFLSDGYIGNEAEVLGLISSVIGRSRIFAFGIGTSVNRFLISEMARMGRGYSRVIDPTSDSHMDAIKFARRLNAPVLTDIEVDWGALELDNITPRRIPDLFKGSSLRIMARSSVRPKPGSRHQVLVTGMVNGVKASMPVDLTIGQNGPGNFGKDSSAADKAGDFTTGNIPQTGAHNDRQNGRDQASNPLPLIWARGRIAEYMRDLHTPLKWRRDALSNDELEDRVTSLGLKFSLMTQWTSLVAVSQKIINASPDAALEVSVPLNQVMGVSKYAYTPAMPRRVQKRASRYRPSIRSQDRSFIGSLKRMGNFTPYRSQGTLRTFGQESKIWNTFIWSIGVALFYVLGLTGIKVIIRLMKAII